MLKILGCVTVDHDLRLVVLAGLVCLFASFTAIELLSRARQTSGRTRALWVIATGVVAGCGVWATHFVAMLAYQSALPISYDLTLTVLSILAAVTLATAGVALGARRCGRESSAARSSGSRSERCTISAWPHCAGRSRCRGTRLTSPLR